MTTHDETKRERQGWAILLFVLFFPSIAFFVGILLPIWIVRYCK